MGIFIKLKAVSIVANSNVVLDSCWRTGTSIGFLWALTLCLTLNVVLISHLVIWWCLNWSAFWFLPILIRTWLLYSLPSSILEGYPPPIPLWWPTHSSGSCVRSTDIPDTQKPRGHPWPVSPLHPICNPSKFPVQSAIKMALSLYLPAKGITVFSWAPEEKDLFWSSWSQKDLGHSDSSPLSGHLAILKHFLYFSVLLR